MTCGEVADQMGDIMGSGVDKLERSALQKLRRSPTLFLMYQELGRERRSNNIGTMSRDEY